MDTIPRLVSDRKTPEMAKPPHNSGKQSPSASYVFAIVNARGIWDIDVTPQ